MVRLYEDGDWQQADDPIREREDGDVEKERAAAGYYGRNGTDSEPALAVPYSGSTALRRSLDSGCGCGRSARSA